MIPIKKLLYTIDQKLNKISSGRGQNIPVPNKLLSLNESQKRLLKKKVGNNNIYNLGFDSFLGRYQQLENLVVQQEKTEVIKTSEVNHSFYFNLDDLQEKLFLPINLQALASEGSCKDRLINIPRLVDHSEINYLINDPNFGPSFLYQETLAVESGSRIIIYSGDFNIDRAIISYIRYPKDMRVQGYVDLITGEDSPNVDCELSEMLEDELVELTVEDLATNTLNIEVARNSRNKRLDSEL